MKNTKILLMAVLLGGLSTCIMQAEAKTMCCPIKQKCAPKADKCSPKERCIEKDPCSPCPDDLVETTKWWPW